MTVFLRLGLVLLLGLSGLGRLANADGPNPDAPVGPSGPLARPSIFDYLTNLFGNSSSTTQGRFELDERATRTSPTSAEQGTKDYSKILPVQEAINLQLFGEPCRSVVNKRSDTNRIMIPIQSKVEWDSFQAHPPPEVIVGPCYCNRMFTTAQIPVVLIEVLGYDPARQAMPWYDLPYSARPPTTNKICQILGCGPATFASGRRFDSAGDDYIMHWNSAWQVWPASADNWKLNHIGGALMCSTPPLP